MFFFPQQQGQVTINSLLLMLFQLNIMRIESEKKKRLTVYLKKNIPVRIDSRRFPIRIDCARPSFCRRTPPSGVKKFRFT